MEDFAIVNNLDPWKTSFWESLEAFPSNCRSFQPPQPPLHDFFPLEKLKFRICEKRDWENHK